ncbi:hypothetical protein [Acidovorax sp. SUPP2539]|uniref:hypothetical protein n=1 Tax=Acidovorax sp. SUPP2539 TaxID=2920878 RepID=UPI0023DE4BAF|nr:hypothetical protein [Acidovorax sp. SUPP2539]GKS89601.1 hypothetical protein AVTE2539_09570 [Acidovorax sp. SUPP2539]
MKVAQPSSAQPHGGLSRSESMPTQGGPKLAPEVRRFDTLQHPLGSRNARNPGTVSIARNNPSEWSRVACTEGSLLSNIEVRPHKRLLNLTGSDLFATGGLSQTQKRDLQRAVTSVVMAYNTLAEKAGAKPITIHENHLAGDGKVHEDRKIPRASNERDYDYYHTLGVSFADNGRMLPHYHLEFGDKMGRHNVAPILQSLRHIGQQVLGQDILGDKEIAAILAKLPAGLPVEGLNAQQIEAARQRLPNEQAAPEERAKSRDDLESAFIALSSQNTEDAEPKRFIRNMHMNSFRPAEPMLECFSAGHTSVMDDLAKVEAYPDSAAGQPVDAKEWLAVYLGLRTASRELGGYEGGSEPERQAIQQRLTGAMGKIQQMLSLP